MCGICGVYNYKSLYPVEERDLVRMCDVMAYRGPDDHGIMAEGPIGLGHRRLSIIDIGGGHQPMFNNDRTVGIVYNGEIYNYIELRENLIKKGWSFRTSSDTEVLIKMYEEYGQDCLQYLNGMFAFAIWDSKRKRLFMARDRLGIKPLYYAETSGGIVFGSEIKTILQLSYMQAEVNNAAIDLFLSYGYMLGRDTIFKGIKKLMPGETLSVDNKILKKRKYWDIEYNVGEIEDERVYIDRLNELLEDSIQLRLRSDVPVGVFLSGGVDSSAVVAKLCEKLTRQLKTFSVSFDKGKDFDESPYSNIIAEKFKTDHYHFYLSPEKFFSFIPDLVWHLEEPIAEPPAVSLYYVSKLASEHVKVVLSGEGSDELFAGYSKYRFFKNIDKFHMLSPALKLLARSPRLKRLYHLVDAPFEKRYLGGHSLDLYFRNRLYSNDFNDHVNDFNMYDYVGEIYKKTESQDILNRMLYLDQNTWLPENLLLKADRMSMATSIELRVPFLDHRLAEFAATVPPHLKLKGKETKYILKKALSDVLPPEILYRKKMGFPAPIGIMFRNEGREYIMDTLFSKKAMGRGYFNYTYIKQIMDEHLSEKRDHRYILWQLLILEEWHKCFID